MIDPVAPKASPGAALLEAVAVMDRLRSPGGCPWDAEQTHTSLAPYAIEEAHEVAEAAETGDDEALAEELGDLLLQVLFHARVASERKPAGAGFDIDDVAAGLVAKLVRRHPHVFTRPGAPPPGSPAGAAPQTAGAAAPQTPATAAPQTPSELTPAEVNAQWDSIKAVEKRRVHVLDDIPASLPALARAQKMVSRLRKAGAAPSDIERIEPTEQDENGRLGTALLALVAEADAAGVDAEAALRAAVRDLESQHRRDEHHDGPMNRQD